MKKALFIMALALAIAGCASYKAQGVVPMSGGQFITADGREVLIKILPLLTEEESKRYFDENLPGRDILAVYLEVFSKSPENLKIASLELKAGGAFAQPLTAEKVYKVVKREYAGKVSFWTVMGFYVGGPLSAMDTRRVNEKIDADIKGKELPREIIPYGSSSGFVWFKLPDKSLFENPRSMVLSVTVENGKDAPAERHSLPLAIV